MQCGPMGGSRLSSETHRASVRLTSRRPLTAPSLGFWALTSVPRRGSRERRATATNFRLCSRRVLGSRTSSPGRLRSAATDEPDPGVGAARLLSPGPATRSGPIPTRPVPSRPVPGHFPTRAPAAAQRRAKDADLGEVPGPRPPRLQSLPVRRNLTSQAWGPQGRPGSTRSSLRFRLPPGLLNLGGRKSRLA